MAYLGHDNALKPARRLRDELTFWARLDGARDPAPAWARFGLDALLDLPVGVLSNGQRRRAGLARVAASGAVLWLLDEPEVGLDAVSMTALGEAITEHRGAGGMVVAVSHGGLTIADAAALRLEGLAVLADDR